VVHGFEGRRVVVVELDTAIGKFGDISFDVCAPEPHLSMVGEVGVGSTVDQQRRTFARC